MRTAFIDTLCEIAAERDDIVLLCGDLGYSVLERFSDRFPDRFFNVGIAEQNMAGMACGLALAGRTVVTYSIANFAITRCLEQIRNDICYHNSSVIVVSVGSGAAYGPQGYTHFGIEDMSFTRVLPNMAVLSPGDPVEAGWGLRELIARGGPASLRLGRGGEPVVHEAAGFSAEFGKAIMLRPAGGDVVFLCTGVALPEAVAAADVLTAQGISAGVLSLPTVAPLDVAAIVAVARTAKLLVTVEEHSIQGGLGSAVAEVLAEQQVRSARLLRAGIIGSVPKTVSDQTRIRQIFRFDAAGLVAQAQEILAAS